MIDPKKVEQAWRKGIVTWKLDSNQVGMFEWLTEAWLKGRKIVLNASRQIGKSFFICAFAIQYALQHPGAQIKYAAQTAKQVRKIVKPHFRELLGDCPEDLRPVFNREDSEYRFRNGSTITIAGCDKGNAETLRGQHCHLGIVDEGGAIDDLLYVVNDILLPQCLNTKGRLVIISTPAKTPGHPFKQLCDEADARGMLLERTIYDNPRISDDEIEEMKRESGGEDSTTWKREYLVQHVTDEAMAVLPEATKKEIDRITLKLKSDDDRSYRPAYFDTYIFLDPGWNPDFAGISWAIMDYENASWIIEDEFIMRKMSTNALAAVLRERTDRLWGVGHRPFACWSDIDGRLIADLALIKSEDGGPWFFSPTQKDNLDQAINGLRQSITHKKHPLWIHPSCKATRRQFQNVMWNKQRSKFARTSLDGHYDLVAANIYGRRNINFAHNPFPQDYWLTKQFGSNRNFIVIPDPDAAVTKAGKAVKSLFGFKLGR